MRLLIVGVLAAAFALLCTATASARDVLPPPAQPYGWSLEQMTGASALFTTSNNNPSYYPDTPFQVLHTDLSTVQAEPVDGGLKYTGSNSFTVRTGTHFFVPLWNADDSPPIVGVWPTTHQDAISYFFDPSQVGGKDFAITIDGQRTAIGSAYLSGPVTTPPLLDGGGTHFITLGAFVPPLKPGSHTISISGGVFGQDISVTYAPYSFEEEDFRYNVTVR